MDKKDLENLEILENGMRKKWTKSGQAKLYELKKKQDKAEILHKRLIKHFQKEYSKWYTNSTGPAPVDPFSDINPPMPTEQEYLNKWVPSFTAKKINLFIIKRKIKEEGVLPLPDKKIKKK
jgi:hypothetical protein